MSLEVNPPLGKRPNVEVLEKKIAEILAIDEKSDYCMSKETIARFAWDFAVWETFKANNLRMPPQEEWEDA